MWVAEETLRPLIVSDVMQVGSKTLHVLCREGEDWESRWTTVNTTQLHKGLAPSCMGPCGGEV